MINIWWWNKKWHISTNWWDFFICRIVPFILLFFFLCAICMPIYGWTNRSLWPFSASSHTLFGLYMAKVNVCMSVYAYRFFIRLLFFSFFCCCSSWNDWMDGSFGCQKAKNYGIPTEKKEKNIRVKTISHWNGWAIWRLSRNYQSVQAIIYRQFYLPNTHTHMVHGILM